MTLDLRGATVVDLVRALEREGVPVLASERAWTSRGTLSVVVHEIPLGHLGSAWPGELSVRVLRDPRDPSREAVVITGELLAVTTDLLAGDVPEVVAADVNATRSALRAAASARLAARALPDAATVVLRPGERRPALADLGTRERDVQRCVRDAAEALASARALAAAPDRVREVEAALAAARAAAAPATRPHLALLHQQRVLLLEGDLRTARHHLERLEARLGAR
ncbi:MAG: hypothetical protein KF878_26335 [Planctomycetes bacterium]|nr:hypothetical protein [Planctomycetota bacterium]